MNLQMFKLDSQKAGTRDHIANIRWIIEKARELQKNISFIDYVKAFAEKAMAPHSSTFAWKIPWTEEAGRLPSMGSLRVGHKWSNLAAAVAKPLTVWITTNYGKFFERWEYQTTLPASWEICMQVKKQQLELGMKQQTGSKLGKKCNKDLYRHLAYLTYMQEYIMGNARLDEAQAGIKVAGRNKNNLRNTDDTTLTAESEEELKSLLMKVKEESEKLT